MLPTALILEVRRLLDEGELSQRQLAAKLGVSRGTVGAVANGRRGLHGHDPADAAAAIDEPEPLPSRCAECGGRVYKPCVLCAARSFRRRAEQLRGRRFNRRVRRERGEAVHFVNTIAADFSP